ncbi:MAG: type VI immunity family protein [Nannocystales bacterium]
MKSWTETIATYTELDDTIVVGRPALSALFFGNAGLAQAGLACFEDWLARFEPKTPLYYSHDNSRRIMKLTPKAVKKVRDVFSEQSLETSYQHYYFKTADPKGAIDECHGHSFEMLITKTARSYMHLTLPLDTDPAELEALFRAWCSAHAFSHAAAGFGFEVAWFNEQAQLVYAPVLRTGLRFHGVRVFYREHIAFMQDSQQTMDTVGWLNYVGADSLEVLGPGALDALQDGVRREDLGDGILLAAGDAPDPCDVNRPNETLDALRSINAALEPIRTQEWTLKGFARDPDQGYVADPDREQDWLTRLDA